MNIRHHVFELVAPATALGAIVALIVVNHFLKFCITVRNIKRNIRNWNNFQEQLSPISRDSVKSTGTSSGRTSPIRATI
ncbi:15360_t:CDS:2, partial [Entrophospora sp. SA101]